MKRVLAILVTLMITLAFSGFSYAEEKKAATEKKEAAPAVAEEKKAAEPEKKEAAPAPAPEKKAKKKKKK